MFEGISVIVTIYNAKKYLSRCLESISNQTFRDLEIILINDGSTDNSEEICRKYIDNDPRFTLISKINGGVSSARNEGIQIANGKYIAFVDSDDYLKLDMYQLLYEEITQDCCDMIVCSFLYDYGMKIKPYKARKPFCLLSQSEYFEQIISDAYSFYNGVVWNKLYCKEIIKEHKIYFNENINYMEDWNFNLSYLKYAKTITKIPDQLYYYNKANQESFTQNKLRFESSYINRMQGYYDLCDYSNSIGCYKENRDYISDYLLRYLICQKYKILLSSNKNEALKVHEMISNRTEINSVISSMNKLVKLKKSLYYNFKYLKDTILEISRNLKGKIV